MKNNQHDATPPQRPVSAPRTIAHTPILKLVSCRVRSDKNGVEKDFFKLQCPAWVNIVALTEKKEIVMIRQYRFGSDRLELEIPGGAVEKGEAPLDAGLRELLEETGYAGENGRIIGKVCPNPAIQDNYCYTVLVDKVKQVAEPSLDEMEDIEVLIMPQEETFAMVRDGGISHGLVLNGLMFYAMAAGIKLA